MYKAELSGVLARKLAGVFPTIRGPYDGVDVDVDVDDDGGADDGADGGGVVELLMLGLSFLNVCKCTEFG